MNTRLLLSTIAVVLVLGGGYYFYTQNRAAPTTLDEQGIPPSAATASAVSCLEELYRDDLSQYDNWEAKFMVLHPTFSVYDAGSYCKLSDGTQLVSFSFFKPYTGEWKGVTAENAGQSVALFDTDGNLLAETRGLFEQTLGDLGYPLIISVKNGIATFVLGGGDAGYSASATYELRLGDFTFKKVSSTNRSPE